MQQNEWIYDWNVAATPLIAPGTRVLLNDETLRDGLQNPCVHDPSIEEKIEILHLMEALGIDSLNIGLPGAGARAVEHAEALAREIVTKRMKIKPNCAARTIEADIRPIAEISQRVGMAIEAATFLGSSPIRRLVEDWTVDHLERTTEKAVKFAVEHGLPSMYVTEDTIRTDPDTVKRLYTTADSQRRARHRVVRHRGPRHSKRRVQPREIRDRRSREAQRRKNSRGLAWPQRSRLGHCEFLGGDCGGCGSSPRRGQFAG